MQKTTTTCETKHPLASLHQCKALWVVWRTHQTRNMGVEERKARMGGPISSNCSFCPSPPNFSPISSCRQWAPAVLHTSPNTTTTILRAQQCRTLQKKVVFFPFHGGEGKLRPKEGQLCPVPFSKAEFNRRELKISGGLRADLQP